ncbi:MAG: cysteine desulfurase family protein [Flavobacteriaceae bacterium]
MELVYFDNAASTALDPRVIDFMAELMKSNLGNPSSTHKFGRMAKSLVEGARKEIATLIHCESSEIIFTSGGSEADNLILRNAVENIGVQRIISTRIEHAAVINTIKNLEQEHDVTTVYLGVDQNGCIDYTELENELASSDLKTLVSLMYVNNEIGTILDVEKVGAICENYNALFHTDGVQAVGHIPLDLSKLKIDFLAASAHKFHGPKGVGFAYFKKGYGVKSMLHGGGQEKGARAGTENVHSIAGMAKALSFAQETMDSDRLYIQEIKDYLISELHKFMPEITFNANSDNCAHSAYHILSVQLPGNSPMLLFSLDLNGVAVSGGSACQSGSNKGSHVLTEILNDDEQNNTSIRISLSKENTKADVDRLIDVLKSL